MYNGWDVDEGKWPPGDLAFEQALEVFSLSCVLPVMAAIFDLLVTRYRRVFTLYHRVLEPFCMTWMWRRCG